MNAMAISTLRPGLLVSLKTTLSGNVHYSAKDIETDHLDADGARRAVWETTRVVDDPTEHEAGVKARSKARSLITGVCAHSTFGLLCPESDADKLRAAITEARAEADAFNAEASLTTLAVNVIVGRIAADDVEAVRAINSEIRDLMYDMERGLRSMDVQTIREAANKARALSTMLSPVAAERARKAIDAARAAARQIVKAGEEAAQEVDQAVLDTIRNSRLAFLDLDEADEIQAPEAASRGLDLEMEVAAPAPAAPSVDLDIDEEAEAKPSAPPISLFPPVEF